ncbi:LysR substrate-binding domain-containing protein [Streptomyces sp. NPDC051913]|uniref:LysR substrate-binding domain-containing protein n=1 Tax=Streptomyces sp. NPDC051913 TaxID=3365676 RepID=UPI0037CE13F1
MDRVLAAFTRRAPQVPVELVSLPAAERLTRVAGGQLDAAFVRAVEPVPGVRVLPLWSDPLVAALPREGMAFVPFRAPGLALSTGLAVRAAPWSRTPVAMDWSHRTGTPFKGVQGAAGKLTADRQPFLEDMDRGRCGPLVEARNAPWYFT